MGLRLGIYGGTFDPPHNGHIGAAQAFLREARLDALYIIPAAISSHKRTETGNDPAVRLALTRAAFDGLDPRITVSDYEIMSGGIGYTYKTLTHFAETTEAELFFLCGTDKFLTLDSWMHPEIIFARATVACMMRENDPEVYRAVSEADASYKKRYGARTVILSETPLELSSSRVRQILTDGGDVSALIPKAVIRMIRLYSLYRGE